MALPWEAMPSLGDITTFGFQYPFALDSLAWLCEDGEWMEGGYQSLVYSYGYKLNLEVLWSLMYS